MKQKGRTLVSLSFALVSVDNDLIRKKCLTVSALYYYFYKRTALSIADPRLVFGLIK